MYRLFILFLSILLSVFVFIGFLPTILSSPFGKTLLLDRILNPWVFQPNGFQVEVEKLHLHWFGPQTLEKISGVSDIHSWEVQADRITTKTSLIRLFFYSAIEDGTIENLALKDPASEVSIDHAKLEFSKGGSQGFSKLIFNGIASLTPFEFRIILPENRNWQDLKKVESLEWIELEGSSLPVSFVDLLISSVDFSKRGLLSEAVGRTIDLSIQQTNTGTSIHVKSPQIEANLALEKRDHEMHLQKDGMLKWTLTSEFAKRYNQIYAQQLFPTEQQSEVLGTIHSFNILLDRNLWDFDATIQCKFPNGLISSVLGKNAEAKLQISSTPTNATGSLSFDSEHIHLNRADFLLGETISLIEPILLDFQVNPQLLNSSFGLTVSAEKIPLNIRVQKCNFRYPSLQVQSQISSFDSKILKIPNVGSVRVSNLTSTISGDLFRDFNTQVNANIQSINENFLLEKVAVAFSGNFIRSDTSYAVPDYTLKIKSPQGMIDLHGSIDESKIFGSGKISYSIDDKEWVRLGLVQKNIPSPYGSSQLSIIIDHLLFPLDYSLMAQMKIEGSLEMDSISFRGIQNESIASIKNIQAPWNIDAKTNKVIVSVSAQTYDSREKQAGSVFSKIDLLGWHINNNIDFRKVQVNIDSKITHLPTALFESLFRKQHLRELVGPQLDFNLIANFNLSEKKPGEVLLDVKGKQIQIHGEFVVENTIVLKDKNHSFALDWEITPERFATIRKAFAGHRKRSIDALVLEKPVSIHLRLTDLSIPWLIENEQSKIYFQKHLGLPALAATAVASLKPISLFDTRTKRRSFIEDVEINCSTKDLFKKIAFSFTSHGKDEKPKQEEIYFSLNALIENPLKETGEWNPQEFSLSLDSQAKNVPIGLFCDVALLSDQMVDQMDVFIGSRLDNQIEIAVSQAKGVIKADIKGDVGAIGIDGNVDNGFLTLRSPLFASLKVSPKLGQTVLQPLVPFLSTAYRSENPIKISLSPQGFRFPLLNWDPSLIRVEHAVVDLGIIYFYYGKQIEEILGLLNYTFQNAESVSIWFTPLYFSLQDGVAECQRIDMLVADRFPIALWGNVDFNNDKVRLILGLSGKALKNAFGIKGISDGVLLQLPIKGTTSKAEIDQSKSLARIASLIAHSSKGPEGLIVGSVVDILSGAVGDKKPPNPTTSPFPWEKNKTNQIEEEKESEPKSSVEQWIEKGTKEIFKFLKKRI